MRVEYRRSTTTKLNPILHMGRAMDVKHTKLLTVVKEKDAMGFHSRCALPDCRPCSVTLAIDEEGKQWMRYTESTLRNRRDRHGLFQCGVARYMYVCALILAGTGFNIENSRQVLYRMLSCLAGRERWWVSSDRRTW